MKVLVLYASLGAGHKRAAQALQEAFREREIEYEDKDLLEFLPGPMPWFYEWGYNLLITKGRGLWRFLYETLDRPKSPYMPARDVLQRWQFTALRNYVRQSNFSHILSTHYTPSALLTDWRSDGVFQAKIFSIVTDYSAHRCWKRNGLDHYFVPTEEVAAELVSAGISQENITTSGIPVSLAFSAPLSREDSRRNWNCGAGDHVSLILCSAFTLAKTMGLLEEIGTLDQATHFLVSTGSDPVKERTVKQAFSNDPRFTIVGFSSRIAEMMRSADVIVTKPGGLIVSEALAMGLPQLLLPAIPGQEEANANYALRNGAALSIQDKKGDLKETLSKLFANPSKLASMGESARRVGKPNAGRIIVDEVLS